jgi:hypothetical protein
MMYLVFAEMQCEWHGNGTDSRLRLRVTAKRYQDSFSPHYNLLFVALQVE